MFFGGARGGGKTDGVLGKWALKEARFGPLFNGIMFRRTTVSSEDAIERSKQIYGPLGGRFTGSPQPTWHLPGGGRVSFRYLDRVSDAEEWQGRNVSDVWVEEAGQYPTPDPIDRLFGVMRSSGGIPVQMILTANPGGAGQNWIRDRFGLWPFPKAPVERVVTINEGTIKAIVIPSRLGDNRVLMDADPDYVERLRMVGSPELVRAWLEGDWSAVEGAFFSEWSERKHVLEPFPIPEEWTRFRSMDWGFAAPFSIGWWAIVGDDYAVADGHRTSEELHPVSGSDVSEVSAFGKVIPRGALIRYREWYGASGPGKGIRLTAEEVAQGIKQREEGEDVAYGVLDPSAFAMDGGPSIAERMLREGVTFRPADNKRIARVGAIGGWDQMRARLRGIEGVPMLYAFDTCRDFIRTIPVLQHDPDKAEDLDTDAEDHAADEARYACMSRPLVHDAKPKPKPSHTFEATEDGIIRSTLTISELIKRKTQRRKGL